MAEKHVCLRGPVKIHHLCDRISSSCRKQEIQVGCLKKLKFPCVLLAVQRGLGPRVCVSQSECEAPMFANPFLGENFTFKTLPEQGDSRSCICDAQIIVRRRGREGERKTKEDMQHLPFALFRSFSGNFNLQGRPRGGGFELKSLILQIKLGKIVTYCSNRKP